MAKKKKAECDYCSKVTLLETGTFDNTICNPCYNNERETINQHHKDVGYSCYCLMCM